MRWLEDEGEVSRIESLTAFSCFRMKRYAGDTSVEFRHSQHPMDRTDRQLFSKPCRLLRLVRIDDRGLVA